MKNNSYKKNGQIFSLDFLIAIIAFAAVLAASAVVWDYTTGKTDSTESRNGMEIAAMNVLSVLIWQRLLKSREEA